MNKQIEELTNELVFTSNYGTYNAVADYLYNKGYRKSTDVAREIFEEIENNSFVYGVNYLVSKETLAEIKKKYESEGAE